MPRSVAVTVSVLGAGVLWVAAVYLLISRFSEDFE